MTKIEFTKEWFTKNKLAIRCWSLDEANKMCDILDIENTYHKQEREWVNDGKFVGVDNIPAIYKSIMASEVIAQYEEQIRKIIGYIYPFKSINGHKVQERSIVKKTSNDYTLDIGDIRTLYIFPAEIVETWEPVYEDVKPCFRSFDDIFKYFKGNKITFKEGEPITVYDTDVLVGTGRTHFILNKQDYDFTPEFESKLKEMGINI